MRRRILALETLNQAMGTSLTADDVSADPSEVIAYLSDHLSATSADGTEWGETFGDASVESVEGIESLTVDVTFDTGASDISGFELTYDAVIESIPDHEAVVVLTDAAGDVSTAGVITSGGDTVSIGSSAEVSSGILDMIGYGFHHVLEGADHLLFLTALLMTAPVAIVADAGDGVPK